MRRLLAFALFLGLAHAAPSAGVDPGAPAPDFRLLSDRGTEVSLAAFRGKLVVLEWTNPECPFVHKHYDSGNMQALQRRYRAKGVVWLAIDSSAPGREGCLPTPADARAFLKERGADPTALLLDPHGLAGRAYGAKSTPTMVVVDRAGRVAYEGAIDDRPSTDVADVPGARNYVAEALDALLAGRPVAVARTRSYGCSVKYD